MTKKSHSRLIKEELKDMAAVNNAYSLLVGKLGDAEYRRRNLEREMKQYKEAIDEIYERANALTLISKQAQGEVEVAVPEAAAE